MPRLKMLRLKMLPLKMLRRLMSTIAPCGEAAQQQQQHIAKRVRTVLTSKCLDPPLSILSSNWERWLSHTKLDSVDLSSQQAIGQITSMLTYTLTLQRICETLLASRNITSSLTVHIVGARAEVYIPPWVWAVLDDFCEVSSVDLQLVLVGPAVPEGLPKIKTRRTEINSIGGCLYHQITESTRAPDAFVCFHPGWGEVAWTPVWRPTLEFMKSSSDTAICFFTGYDVVDHLNDLQVLWDMFEVAPIRTELNPFRSLLPMQLSSESQRIIQSNCYISAVEF